MTDTEEGKDSVMQSWPSGWAVWLKIRWGLPAQVRILLCDTFRPPVPDTSYHQKSETMKWGNSLRKGNKVIGQFKKHWPTPIKLEILKCSHGGVVRTSDKKSDTVFLHNFAFLWLRKLASTQHINPTKGPEYRKRNISMRKRKKVTQKLKN